MLRFLNNASARREHCLTPTPCRCVTPSQDFESHHLPSLDECEESLEDTTSTEDMSSVINCEARIAMSTGILEGDGKEGDDKDEEVEEEEEEQEDDASEKLSLAPIHATCSSEEEADEAPVKGLLAFIARSQRRWQRRNGGCLPLPLLPDLDSTSQPLPIEDSSWLQTGGTLARYDEGAQKGDAEDGLEAATEESDSNDEDWMDSHADKSDEHSEDEDNQDDWSEHDDETPLKALENSSGEHSGDDAMAALLPQNLARSHQNGKKHARRTVVGRQQSTPQTPKVPRRSTRKAPTPKAPSRKVWREEKVTTPPKMRTSRAVGGRHRHQSTPLKSTAGTAVKVEIEEDGNEYSGGLAKPVMAAVEAVPRPREEPRHVTIPSWAMSPFRGLEKGLPITPIMPASPDVELKRKEFALRLLRKKRSNRSTSSSIAAATTGDGRARPATAQKRSAQSGSSPGKLALSDLGLGPDVLKRPRVTPNGDSSANDFGLCHRSMLGIPSPELLELAEQLERRFI